MQSLDLQFTNRFARTADIAPGDLLVAEPFLNDPNFERTVVLMCEHQNHKGSFGLVLNKTSAHTVAEATDKLYVDAPLYVGGPVEQNTLHFVHRLDEVADSIPLKDGLYWGGNFEQLAQLQHEGSLTPEHCRFFMGYSGWGANQLADELQKQSWVVAKANLGALLEHTPTALWQAVLQEMGGKFRLFANYPTDPRLN